MYYCLLHRFWLPGFDGGDLEWLLPFYWSHLPAKGAQGLVSNLHPWRRAVCSILWGDDGPLLGPSSVSHLQFGHSLLYPSGGSQALTLAF